MIFDVISPRLSLITRYLLYIILFFLIVYLGVSLTILLINVTSSYFFAKNNAELFSVLISLIPISIAVIGIKIRKNVIDKSDVIGDIQIETDRLIIRLLDSTKFILNDNISYVRFKSAMGWSVTSSNVYQIQIVLKNSSKVDVEFVQAKNNGKYLKSEIEANGIQARYWNLS